MIYNWSKDKTAIDLAMVILIEADEINKKSLIKVYHNAGVTTISYDTKEERDKEYDKIIKAWRETVNNVSNEAVKDDPLNCGCADYNKGTGR